MALEATSWVTKTTVLASSSWMRRNSLLAFADRDAAGLQIIQAAVALDHATGLVVGETAVIGDDVSILQDVTLGGTGKHGGDRHPKIRNGVIIGACARILGNIEVGENARVAAGSVVLITVPPGATAAGVPARIVRTAADDGAPRPAAELQELKYAGFDYTV